METPDAVRGRAVAASTIITGVCVLLADAAGLRTALRRTLTDLGVASVAANLIYFAISVAAFGVVFRLAIGWFRPRADAIEPRRPWWRRKRFAAALLLWLAAAYPLSHLGLLYLSGRRVLSLPVEDTFSRAYMPLVTVIIDPTGRPRPGFGWCLKAMREAHDAGRRPGWRSMPAPLLPPQQVRSANEGR